CVKILRRDARLRWRDFMIFMKERSSPLRNIWRSFILLQKKTGRFRNAGTILITVNRRIFDGPYIRRFIKRQIRNINRTCLHKIFYQDMQRWIMKIRHAAGTVILISVFFFAAVPVKAVPEKLYSLSAVLMD